jgi:hypothetical protein
LESLRIKKSFLGMLFGIIFSFQWFFLISSVCAETFVSQVKAAFVLKIIDFVKWPDKENTTFMVSVLGDEELFESFKSLGINKAQGKSLVLKRYNLNDIGGEKFDVFFISKLKRQKLSDILAQFENTSVLLIGDDPSFAQMGGMVSLVESKGKLGMEINLRQVKKAGLKISSRLLRLAKIVDN